MLLLQVLSKRFLNIEYELVELVIAQSLVFLLVGLCWHCLLLHTKLSLGSLLTEVVSAV